MNAKFIKSATDVQDFFKDKRPQICLVGRSNVGKSSLINALANINNLAKVSKTPGRTRLINFFDFEKFVLVDLPGYGYAKADQKTKELIYDLIIRCLNYNEKLTTVIQLCNIDVLTDDDQKMSVFLNKMNVNHLVFLTKADKVNNSFFTNNKKKYLDFLKIKEDQLFEVSSKNKKNITKVLTVMNSISQNQTK